MKQYIYGKNSIQEWLASGLKVEEILIAKDINPQSVRLIRSLAGQHKIPVHKSDRRSLALKVRHDNHQGVVASVKMVPYAALADILRKAKQSGEQPLIAVLDGVQDPQNLGAIIRSADGAGFHGVVIPRDNGFKPIFI